MLIVNGDFEKVKAEMKEASKARADEARAIKKLHKNPYNRPVLINLKLDSIEEAQNMYKLTKVLPVRIEALVINYKLFKAFMKNLKNYQVNLFVEKEFLVLEYENGQTKGRLELRDLATYFEGFEHIPVAEVECYVY